MESIPRNNLGKTLVPVVSPYGPILMLLVYPLIREVWRLKGLLPLTMYGIIDGEDCVGLGMSSIAEVRQPVVMIVVL